MRSTMTAMPTGCATDATFPNSAHPAVTLNARDPHRTVSVTKECTFAKNEHQAGGQYYIDQKRPQHNLPKLR